MDLRNARSKKSKDALKSAFLEMVQTKEPEDITVVELCERAGLNRSTFYAHYGYMDNFIREVLWESVGKIIGVAQQWDLPLEDGGVQRSFISEYLQRFLSDPTVRRFCTCKNSGNYRTLIIRAHAELSLGTPSDQVRYLTAYFHNAGVLNLLLEWLNSRSAVPQETIVEMIHEFSKVMYR